MLSFDQISQLYHTYLEYLSSGGQRYELPEDERSTNGDIMQVYASDMMKCHLAAALRRFHAPELYPPEFKDLLMRHYVMELGKRIAETMQEAILWGMGERASVERLVSGYDEDLGVRGRYDIKADGAIIEVKVRFSDHPLPRTSDVAQLASYMELTGLDGQLLMFKASPDFGKDWPFDVWVCEENPQLQTYYLVNQDGREWIPERDVTLETLRAEQERHRQFLQFVSENGVPYVRSSIAHGNIIPPLDLTDESNHECVVWREKPKRYKKLYNGRTDKPGSFSIRCGFFCHAPELLAHAGPFAAHVDNAGRLSIDWFGGDEHSVEVP